MNNREETINKLNNLLFKFKNGELRYIIDPIFHSMITSLLNEENPYKIIDNLIDLINNQQEVINKLSSKTPMYQVMFDNLGKKLQEEIKTLEDGK